MKKLYIDRFYMGLYKADITFLFGNQDKFDLYLKKKYGKEEKKYARGGETLEFTNKKQQKDYVLWLPKLDYGALAHEATHLTGFIFEWRGVNATLCDEHYAYMVEWLVREYIKFVKAKRIKPL
jgi:hypothetical protein